MAVQDLLTKIRDTWTIFVVLSPDLLGRRARFSELEPAVRGFSQRILRATLNKSRTRRAMSPRVQPAALTED